MDDLVTLAEVEAAAAVIAGVARRTPLLPSTLAVSGGSLFLKAECLQLGGSFKLRGAYHAISRQSPAELVHGVVTHSSGNHAQAVARAAALAGVPATVVMPHQAPEVKVDATRALGATVVLVDAGEREAAAEQIRAETGAVLIPPYDDPAVIAGQGTVGLEIARDLPEVETIYVPVSGGGLASGVAVAVKALAPSCRVVAVEPELAADFAEGWARGERVAWDTGRTGRTIADGLRVPVVGELNWAHLRAYVDDVVTVSDDEILAAQRRIVLEQKLVAEPSGAAALAGYLKDAASPPGRVAVAVVSGGNVDPAALARLVAPT